MRGLSWEKKEREGAEGRYDWHVVVKGGVPCQGSQDTVRNW